MVNEISRLRGWPAVVAVLLVLVVTAVAIPVSAAGPTQVSVRPTQATASVGETLTFDIVVEEVSGGVGAWEATLNLTDGRVADITEVTLRGDPDLHTVDIAADNDSVYFDAALANTSDTGSVTIVTVTITVTGSGETTLDLRVGALGDEAGNSYSVTGITDATLSVGTDNNTGDSGGAGTAGTDSDIGTNTPSDTDNEEQTTQATHESTTQTETSTPGEPTATPGTETPSTATATATATSTPTSTATTTTLPPTRTSPGTDATSPGFTSVGAVLAVAFVGGILLWRSD